MRVLHLLEAMGGGTKKHVQLIAGSIERGVRSYWLFPIHGHLRRRVR